MTFDSLKASPLAPHCVVHVALDLSRLVDETSCIWRWFLLMVLPFTVVIFDDLGLLFVPVTMAFSHVPLLMVISWLLLRIGKFLI